jgi:nicotinamidase-related amidase
MRPVLVVVDVQNGFVTDHSAPVVPVIAGLVRCWQDTGGAVIFTRYFNYPGSPYERLIGWTALRDSPDTDLTDEMLPLADRPGTLVADKMTYTALTPAVREILDRGGYTDLLICGISTDGCVLKTALDAFDAGYTPWVLTEACASNASSAPPAEVHAAALKLLSRLIGAGQLISCEQALGMLPAAVRTP